MAGAFKLKFSPKSIFAAMGSAFVVYEDVFGNTLEMTHDCGSPAELEHAIKQMHRELDDVLKLAKKKFADAWKARMKERGVED